MIILLILCSISTTSALVKGGKLTAVKIDKVCKVTAVKFRQILVLIDKQFENSSNSIIPEKQNQKIEINIYIFLESINNLAYIEQHYNILRLSI